MKRERVPADNQVLNVAGVEQREQLAADAVGSQVQRDVRSSQCPECSPWAE